MWAQKDVRGPWASCVLSIPFLASSPIPTTSAGRPAPPRPGDGAGGVPMRRCEPLPVDGSALSDAAPHLKPESSDEGHLRELSVLQIRRHGVGLFDAKANHGSFVVPNQKILRLLRTSAEM
ncbi:hypothetical protein E2562_012698 [Oryza meyeriana var. granulata]|uniref:Uncharacterized protein n=1 Tax=Oryza meyeriana var. granulata TaxID=110450 RepID=A0A6G1CG34_9ORYZ|nr:hypothetical protein E2562_012698 [Oryza meyeriana var. granulata]